MHKQGFFNNDSFKIPMPEIFGNSPKNVYVMGIVNCNNDSFYEGSRYDSCEAAFTAAMQMVADGADIIDLGGESTRPGSDAVSEQEELERTLPVIEKIRKETNVLVSIDTSKAEVARCAVEAGADIINDVSALSADKSMADVAAKSGKPVILMHMKGTPKTMQHNPVYSDCITEIIDFLKGRIDFSVSKGISENNIIIDPGIGFGKRLEDNLDILKRLDEFGSLKRPLLMGLSRKSFIGKVLDAQTDERLAGTIAADIYSVFRGARILRVHDVKETVDSINILEAIEGSRSGLV